MPGCSSGGERGAVDVSGAGLRTVSLSPRIRVPHRAGASTCQGDERIQLTCNQGLVIVLAALLSGCTLITEKVYDQRFDQDGDGYDNVDLGGDDCDDGDAGVHPGADDVAYDGIDQDCTGADLTDVDGDGHDSEAVAGGTDCDDGDASISPGATEEDCDGLDQDCDGDDWPILVREGESIQEAIDAAVDGDLLCVEGGTAEEPVVYEEELLFDGAVAEEVWVVSPAGSEATTLQGDGDGSVVRFRDGASGGLKGFTVTGGQAACGGGVYVSDASPTLQELVVSGNEASNGGGICVHGAGSSPVLQELVVSENVSNDGAGININVNAAATLQDLAVLYNQASDTSGKGGGLYVSSDQVTMERLLVVGNSAYQGGGAFVEASDLSLSDACFRANQATSQGGAVRLLGDSGSSTLVTVSRSVFRENETLTYEEEVPDSSGGGAFATYSHRIDLSNVEFYENEGENAAVFYATGGGGVTVTNALMAGNRSTLRYGIFVVNISSVALTNATLAGNGSEADGWAFYLSNGATLEVVNTSFYRNDSAGGGDAVYYAGTDSELSASYSHVFENDPGLDLEGGENIEGDPLLVDTEGGDPAAWNLHLQEGSPLVDAGDPTIEDPDGSTSDIGAYGGPGAEGWLDPDSYAGPEAELWRLCVTGE